MLKALVIDDYKKNRDAVKIAADKYYPSLHILGEADGVQSGIALIKKHSPDIVFLDVEMQDGTGFDVMHEFPNPAFKVIFITGHEEYAFKAFQINAFNYLLKPIDKNEFVNTISKLEKQIEKENLSLQINSLAQTITNTSVQEQKIILRTSDRIVPVIINTIIHCESENSYTTFYFSDRPKLVISSPLIEFENKLGAKFHRIHQSHLINLDYFDYFSKADGGWVIMKDGTKLPLSSRKKDDFLKLIEKL